MSKKKKLSLDDLSVRSFITRLDKGQAGIKGGDIGCSVPGNYNTCYTCHTCMICPPLTQDCTIDCTLICF